jgi:hypothetical protein
LFEMQWVGELLVGGCWLVVGGWWLVVGGWWLVLVGGWLLIVRLSDVGYHIELIN